MSGIGGDARPSTSPSIGRKLRAAARRTGGWRSAARRWRIRRLAFGGPRVSSMDIINALLAADVDPNPRAQHASPQPGRQQRTFRREPLSTGCTPLFRATQSNDMEVVQALLAKGANPNINAMGFTPFLVAAGVGPGRTAAAAGGGGARIPR